MMEMPEVDMCEVTKCFYNEDNQCHANAIQVGSDHAMCDTFIVSSSHGNPADVAMVGACHESDCVWNESLSCASDGINVGNHEGHADCLTFEAR